MTEVVSEIGRLPGIVAARPDWLAERVEQLARAWLVEQPSAAETKRIAGTLWWSMSVYALFGAPLDALIAGGAVPDPSLPRVSWYLGPEGAVADVHHDAVILDPVGPVLHRALAAVITPLSTVSGASPRSLWAIASDALANRALLTAGSGRAEAVVAELAEQIGPDLPSPRFVTVEGRTFVRRSSCCLYYASPLSDGKCVSCPRRSPEDRHNLLTALVEQGRVP